MNCRWAWMLPVLSIVTLLLSEQGLQAQGPPGMMGPGGPGMMGGGQGMMSGGPVSYDPDAMGGAGMMGPGGPGMGGGPGMMGGGDMQGCPPDGMGGGGPGRHGLLGDILGIIGPYPDGGCAAPRWYDFDFGVMSLKRNDSGRNVDFASQGVGGPIVLSSDDLDFQEATSFKFSAMMQWGPGSNLEFTYFGLFGWSETAQVADANSLLFSPYSNFGQTPLNGFAETDAANLATINYYSTFNNYEINFRQRWQSPNCRYQGSWLFGFRYFQLDEDFNYVTRVDGALPADPDIFTRTNVNTNNSLSGLQIGGDLWICLLPGLRIGGEGKFAVLGNHSNVDTTISVTGNGNPVTFTDGTVVGDVAFLGDLAAYVTYRLNYNWTLKVGYQVLYVNGVSLAAENFNPQAPNFFNPGPVAARQPLSDRDGTVFYHGITASLEYMW